MYADKFYCGNFELSGGLDLSRGKFSCIIELFNCTFCRATFAPESKLIYDDWSLRSFVVCFPKIRPTADILRKLDLTDSSPVLIR